MGKLENMAGRVFGRLTVVDRGPNLQNITRWNCICECGNRTLSTPRDLKSGQSGSCGCLSRDKARSKLQAIDGQRFGNLTALRRGENLYGLPAWVCVCDCGQEVLASRGNLAHGRTKSCGCNRFKTGAANWNWNPELTDEARLARRDVYENAVWRKAVMERDGYCCRACSVKGGPLNAHHLEGYSEAPDKRFDVSNGAVLCVRCHKAFHREYGSRGFHRPDFEAFVAAVDRRRAA